jgi:hypothetical protein
VLVARNRKGDIVERRELEQKDITGKQLRKIYDRENVKLKTKFKADKEQLEKKGFDKSFSEIYIPEDTEPKKKGDKRKTVVVSYTTFFRFSLLIYRVRKGRKYQIIFQIPSTVQTPVNSYIGFQHVIAELKQSVLSGTGLSLEEWIFVSKTNPDVVIEGGIKFKRFKSRFNTESREFIDKNVLEYERDLNFDKL